MVVREMQDIDIPAVIALGSRMHEESQYRVLDFDPAKVVDVCNTAMTSDSMLALVGDIDSQIVAIFGGFISPYSYGNELIAKDILVYVAPEHRGSTAFVKIVRRYVSWAKNYGASLIFLDQTTGVDQQKVTDLYSRLGFDPVGGIHRMIVQ